MGGEGTAFREHEHDFFSVCSVANSLRKGGGKGKAAVGGKRKAAGHDVPRTPRLCASVLVGGAYTSKKRGKKRGDAREEGEKNCESRIVSVFPSSSADYKGEEKL